MPTHLSVVLTSGGLDSAVAAALVRQESALALLHVQYGQQAAEPELAAFHALAERLKPAEQLVVPIGTWQKLCDSAIVRPGGDIEDAAAVSSLVAKTFTPMLSPVMLCVAASWAYTVGARRVIWGACLDNPGHYPDRVDAVRLLAWQLAARSLPAERAPVIEAPLMHYDKRAVLELARQLEVPVDLTWSCLRGGRSPCNRCIGCAGRARALEPVA